jgi:hypothetical protein
VRGEEDLLKLQLGDDGIHVTDLIPEEREAEPSGGGLKDPDALGHNLLANAIAWNDGYAICFHGDLWSK